MKKRLINKLCVGLAALLVMASLCACSKEDMPGKVVFTTGFGSDELFRIGDISCTMPEYMLYLTNMQNDYESVFGTRIWDVTYEETTLEDNIKDIVLAQIAQMKSIYLLAQEKEVVLTEEEEKLLEVAAKEYYSSLNEAEIEAIGVTEEIVLQLYTEYALAEKVYQQIVAEVNPEISDDEARTITVEHILLKTYTTDTEGNRIEYSEGMKAEALDTIQEIHEMAVSGEYDFTELAGKYSEDATIRYSFKKDEVSQVLEDTAFKLQTDEVSDVVESEEGYHILKCISTFDKEETDANKLVLIEERKKEAFGQEYDTFVNTLAKKLNDKLWQQVDLIHEEGVETSTFFEVYRAYFPAQ